MGEKLMAFADVPTSTGGSSIFASHAQAVNSFAPPKEQGGNSFAPPKEQQGLMGRAAPQAPVKSALGPVGAKLIYPSDNTDNAKARVVFSSFPYTFCTPRLLQLYHVLLFPFLYQ